jgi:hypothetical protein
MPNGGVPFLLMSGGALTSPHSAARRRRTVPQTERCQDGGLGGEVKGAAKIPRLVYLSLNSPSMEPQVRG